MTRSVQTWIFMSRASVGLAFSSWMTTPSGRFCNPACEQPVSDTTIGPSTHAANAATPQGLTFMLLSLL
jgi:hypothetical protein